MRFGKVKRQALARGSKRGRNLVKRSLIATALCVVLSAAIESQGQYSFDLDVPSARSSFWAVDDIGAANRLEAELEIAELRRDSRWIPAFHLTLSSGEYGVALRLFREFGASEVQATVIATEGVKVVSQRPIDGWRLQKGGRLRVTMDWSMAGTLDLAIDGAASARIVLPFAPKSLKVSASTGEIKGHSLALTRK